MSIIEEEQKGKQRAEYGKEIIKTLSNELKNEFGIGYGERNLRNFKQFFLTFKDIQFGTQRMPNLNWSHYKLLMRLSDKNAKNYYLTEAAENNWSIRTLDRNISTLYYQRLLSSQKKDLVESEMKEKTAEYQLDKLEFIKNPQVLEFLGLPANSGYIEEELDILLCNETDKTLARYSVLNENQQLFAAKYMPYLPTEEELITEIELQKDILKIQFDGRKNESQNSE